MNDETETKPAEDSAPTAEPTPEAPPAEVPAESESGAPAET